MKKVSDKGGGKTNHTGKCLANHFQEFRREALSGPEQLSLSAVAKAWMKSDKRAAIIQSVPVADWAKRRKLVDM